MASGAAVGSRGLGPGLPAAGFVGRRPELARLAGVLAGPPAVVLVEGEAGIGKTRLLQEALAAPAMASRRVLVASCPPVREPFTLGPVVDALRQGRRRFTGITLSPLAGALRPLFPEWAADLPPAPEPLDDALASRHRVFRAMAEILTLLQVDVLVVEDVHWADEATIEFLLFAVAQQPRRVSVAVTYRAEDLPPDSLLPGLSSRPAAGTGYARICLRPLGAPETAALVSSMMGGGRVSAEFAGFLHQHTDGVPLMVEESVRLLHDREDLICRDGSWQRRAAAELAVPDTVRGSVLERMRRLDRHTRRLLQAAAVAGDAVGAEVLAGVAALPAPAADTALSQAAAAGFLTHDGSARVVFRHGLVARAVYDSVAEPDRIRLHLAAARALEGSADPPAEQLARHFRAGRQRAKWCRYAEQAAASATVSGDHVTAVGVLNDLLNDADLPAADRARVAVKLGAAALARTTGGPGLVRDVVATLRGVACDAALTSRQRAEIQNKLGQIIMQSDHPAEFRTELEGAIAYLDENSLEVARSMSVLGWPRADLCPAAEHLAWLARAGRLPMGSRSQAERLTVEINRATALLMLGQESGWEVAASVIRAQPADATPAEERRLTAIWFLNSAFQAMLRGRYADAGERLAAATEFAASIGDHRTVSHVVATRCHLDWLTGRWDGLAERTRQLRDAPDAESAPALEARLVAALAQTAATAGSAPLPDLRGILAEVCDRGILDLLMEPAAALARLLLSDGHDDEALAVTDTPVQVLLAKGTWIWAAEIVPARVEVLGARGDVREARRLVTAFAAGLDGAGAPGPRAALLLCQAMSARQDGRTAAAAELFGRAAAAWQALPRPYDGWLATAAQAGCLLDLGQASQGLALLTEAHRGLAGLGAFRDADRAARVLREHGGDAPRPSRRGRRGYGDQLSPRELDVVRLVAAGWTTPRIGKALFRSPRTVSGQLQSAMRKLGVSSRTALALAAVEAGIVRDAAARAGPGQQQHDDKSQ